MSDETTTAAVSERARAGQSVANPRRLRIGRDGRPLPFSPADDDASAA